MHVSASHTYYSFTTSKVEMNSYSHPSSCWVCPSYPTKPLIVAGTFFSATEGMIVFITVVSRNAEKYVTLCNNVCTEIHIVSIYACYTQALCCWDDVQDRQDLNLSYSGILLAGYCFSR